MQSPLCSFSFSTFNATVTAREVEKLLHVNPKYTLITDKIALEDRHTLPATSVE